MLNSVRHRTAHWGIPIRNTCIWKQFPINKYFLKSASWPDLNPFTVCYTDILAAMVLNQMTLQEHAYAKSQLLCLLANI